MLICNFKFVIELLLSCKPKKCYNKPKDIKIKSNKKLTIGTETHISFVWNYTTNKASGSLYFNGKDVGNTVDQQIGTNIPIDIRTFSFDKNYLGISEFETKKH